MAAEVRKRTAKVAPQNSGKQPKVKAPQPAAGSNTFLFIIVVALIAVATYYLALPLFTSQLTGTTPASPLKTSSFTSPAEPTSISSSSGSPPASDGILRLTDEELLAYTGEDPDKPILVAINGMIFDVSSGRGFYGPGGHYGHFAGRDASRAWVTTCFDPQFLTWDMRGAEKMFIPNWLDEGMEDVADGRGSVDVEESLQQQAVLLVDKFGRVSEEEKLKRREEDAEEMKKGYEAALKHWLDFFRNSPKYKEVGYIVGREPLPRDREDIGLCDEAMKKRPLKGGKYGKLMERIPMGSNGQSEENAQAPPDFVVKGAS